MVVLSFALIRLSKLEEHLLRKQYVVELFSMQKEMFRLVVLPCVDLCRTNCFHVRSAVYVLGAQEMFAKL